MVYMWHAVTLYFQWRDFVSIFMFLLCFVERLQAWRVNTGRTGKWVILEFIIWNSQRINKKNLFKKVWSIEYPLKRFNKRFEFLFVFDASPNTVSFLFAMHLTTVFCYRNWYYREFLRTFSIFKASDLLLRSVKENLMSQLESPSIQWMLAHTFNPSTLKQNRS